MFEYDLYVFGDQALLELTGDHLLADTILHIHNDNDNPTDQIYISLPDLLSSTALVNWRSKLDLQGREAELTILLGSNTHIHHGDFKQFKQVLITDHKILNKLPSSVILDPLANNNVKLTVDHFIANKTYLLCNQFNLLGGAIKEQLAIKLHGNDRQIKLAGIDQDHLLVLDRLNIGSEVDILELDKVLTKEKFNCDLAKILSIKDGLADKNLSLKSKDVTDLSLRTRGETDITSEGKILITNIHSPSGKFYIAANSYIHFKTDQQGCLIGMDLVLDMSKSSEVKREVLFPNQKFKFDTITILGATKVSMSFGGSTKELLLKNCDNVDIHHLVAKSVKYSANKQAMLACYNSQIYEDFLMLGNISATFQKIELNNLEASGLCNIHFNGAAKCKILKLNLNLNASNPDNSIENNLGINIENKDKEPTIIETILAKLSKFYIKSNVKLGAVIIQPIDKISTLFWVDMQYGSRLVADKIFVGFDHDIIIDPKTGSINIQRTKNVLTGSELFSSVSNTKVDKFVYVKAGLGIRFNGNLEVINGDIGLFTKYGDIFLNGKLRASENLIVSASSGSVMMQGAQLDAKLITVYSGTNTYFAETLMKAQEIVAYSLSHYIQTNNSNLQASRITIIAKDNVIINSSLITSNHLTIDSGGDTAILDSELISHSIFTQSVRDFILYSSNINLLQCSYTLFATPGNKQGVIQGGYLIGEDLTLVGIFTPDRQQLLPQLKWQEVSIEEQVPVASGGAYIDAKHGIIAGSTIDAKHSVIIKTADSLYVVPVVLHNEVMAAGGMNKSAIKEVVSRINAGLIDIDARHAGIFVNTLLKAATGNIKADFLEVLASPEEISNQQARVRELKTFIDKPTIGQTIGKYFDFSHSTSISKRIGNLGIYDNYVSQNLSFTQISGDIVLDQSWHNKYDKLYLNAEGGKILIISNKLQEIYTGSGGGEYGKNLADHNRTVIGGNNVYLVADQIVMQASKFNVKGDLKIVARDGVYLLPVAVHERLMYHVGSKTRIEESIVRQVISEINAGFLDIKAGGVFEAVSTLIKATGVNIDARELKLRSEYDIFEKHIHFTGAKKWYGGRNSSRDDFYDALVIPTTISANTIYAKISGDTTIEAAQIMAKEESQLQGGGNISILSKYDIHLHDHTSKKSYLFKCHQGKLTVAGTKTVSEHYYGETPAPTIYYSGGSFFAYSDGRIHLLGAKIIANNIYLTGQQGVKIEAAPYRQEKIITISDSGIRTGYNIGGGNHSLSGELFDSMDKTSYYQLLYEASEIMAKGELVISSSEGDLEVISSKMRFGKADIKVRGLNIHTHQEIVQEEHVSTSSSIGVHVGVQETITATVNRAGNLINKSGTHWLDILDRGLNGYQFYGEASQIKEDVQTLVSGSENNQISNLQNLQSVKFGVWVGANSSTSSNSTTQLNAIDNEFIGGDINIEVDEKAVIQGIRCQVDNFKLKAKSLNIETSHDNVTQETFSSEVTLTIPINGNVSGGISMQGSEGNISSTYYHSNNMIIAKGRLEVNISEDGKVSGVRLQANEVLVRAKNLVVESLQDVLQERLRSLELNIGTQGKLGSKAEVTNRDVAWTRAVGSIIGTQLTNVVVQQTLEIAGSLIANAEVHEDGSLTDKGNAYVEAGTIIAKKLHDYDNGKSFGLGIALNRKTDAKGSSSWGVGMPVVCGFNEKARDILPTIGKGEINITGNSQGGLEFLNHDLNSFIGSTMEEGGNLNATLPVSDIVGFVQSILKPTETSNIVVNNTLAENILLEGDGHESQEEPNVIEQDPSEKIDPNTTSLTQEPLDYSLLLSQKINQELVHLNNDSLEYLTYFFDASEKKTLSVMNSQDDLKPVKIFDVRSGITIGGNDHGIKKASFVRNEKEVTSYRNSSGQFTKKPSLYNYSINAHMPLVSFGGQEYSYDLVNSKEGYLGDVKLQARFMPYVIPHLNAGLSNGLNSSIGWQSGILIGGAEFDDGSKLTANIFETYGVAGVNIGKSGFDAKAGFKASLANVKYNMPISEKCFLGNCFEGGIIFEAGLGIGAKAEIGFSNKKIKANLGGGTIAQAEISIEGSIRMNEEYFTAQQKRTEQIQAKYGHFDTEIKKYNPDVIAKISMMDLFDFGNHEDFDSILKLAEAYSKK